MYKILDRLGYQHTVRTTMLKWIFKKHCFECALDSSRPIISTSLSRWKRRFCSIRLWYGTVLRVVTAISDKHSASLFGVEASDEAADSSDILVTRLNGARTQKFPFWNNLLQRVTS
jgi:hypothetical protein